MSTTVQESAVLADELLQRIAETVGDKAKVSTIFGEPIERQGVMVIPVAKAKFGFGGGGGAGKQGPGRGGGGGATVKPLGYIEVHDGTARFKRIRRSTDLLVLVAAASLVALAVQRLAAGFRPPEKRRLRAAFARRQMPHSGRSPR